MFSLLLLQRKDTEIVSSSPLFHYEYPASPLSPSSIHQKFKILLLLLLLWLERYKAKWKNNFISNNHCIFQSQFWIIHQPSHHIVSVFAVPGQGTCYDLLHFHDRGHRY